MRNYKLYTIEVSAGDRCDYLDDLQCELLRTYDRHRYDDKKVAVKLSINHLDMDEINSILTLYGMIQMVSPTKRGDVSKKKPLAATRLTTGNERTKKKHFQTYPLQTPNQEQHPEINCHF